MESKRLTRAEVLQRLEPLVAVVAELYIPHHPSIMEDERARLLHVASDICDMLVAEKAKAATSKLNITDEYRDMLVSLVDSMADSGHATSWLVDNDKKHFVFLTLSQETATKVHDTLEAAGLLCQTHLGTVENITSIAALPEHHSG